MKTAKVVLPEEHLMFKEKCFQLFEQQIPKLEHRTKRLTAIVEEVAKLGIQYPMYQFYLALACASDDMLVRMRELLIAGGLDQKTTPTKLQ